MCKICDNCKGIMNYDPYFEAEVCSHCGKMEREKNNAEIKMQRRYYAQRIETLRQIVGSRTA